jgi:hypothetical protein
VRRFLRKHAALFREFKNDGWSWAGLALVLNKAKITYDTSTPWNSDSLVQAYSRAQASGKGKNHSSSTQREFDNKASLPPNHDKNRTNLIDAGQDSRVNAADVARQSSPGAQNLEHAIVPSASRDAVKPAPRFKPVSLRQHQPPRAPTEEELAKIEENRRLTFGGS